MVTLNPWVERVYERRAAVRGEILRTAGGTGLVKVVLVNRQLCVGKVIRGLRKVRPGVEIDHDRTKGKVF
jgi:hypothetical protein